MYWFNLKEGLKRCFMLGKLFITQKDSDLTIHDFTVYYVQPNFSLNTLPAIFFYLSLKHKQKIENEEQQIVNSSDSGQFLLY